MINMISNCYRTKRSIQNSTI